MTQLFTSTVLAQGAAERFANKLFFEIVDPIISILFFVALFIFIVNIIRFMVNKESAKRGDIVKSVLWSIVGLFVISSVFTIIFFLGRVGDTNIDVQGPRDVFRGR